MILDLLSFKLIRKTLCKNISITVLIVVSVTGVFGVRTAVTLGSSVSTALQPLLHCTPSHSLHYLGPYILSFGFMKHLFNLAIVCDVRFYTAGIFQLSPNKCVYLFKLVRGSSPRHLLTLNLDT